MKKTMEKDGNVKYIRNDDTVRLLIKEGWALKGEPEEAAPEQAERKKTNRKQK